MKKIKKFVTYVLFRKRVDELREDLVGHNSLSQLIRVVGETAESKSSGLLDRGNIIEEKGSQEGHNAYKIKSVSFSFKKVIERLYKSPYKLQSLTGTLEGFNVLWALSELGNGLDEGNSSLLVGLEGGKNCTGHL